MKYCPDCGAEVHEDTCPDCEFPLKLEVLDDGVQFHTPRHQRKQWQRLYSLMRKTGIGIEPHSRSSMTERQAWLLLPGFGLLFLIFSLFFSRPIANILIPLKEIPVAIAFSDSNTQSPDSSLDEKTESESISALKEALHANEDEHLTLSQDEFEERRPVLDESQIRELVESCLIRVNVADEQGFGTLFLESGYAFSTTNLMEQAYSRVRGTIQGDKTFIQGSQLIVPEAHFQGTEQTVLELSHQLDEPPLTILKLDVAVSLPFRPNFQDNLLSGASIWSCHWELGQLLLQKTGFNRTFYQNEIPFFVFTSDQHVAAEGAPVFNEYGDLVGIQAVLDGQDGFLALVSLREKAPYVYRDIHKVLQGGASDL